jgi:hypothetical protein
LAVYQTGRFNIIATQTRLVGGLVSVAAGKYIRKVDLYAYVQTLAAINRKAMNTLSLSAS